MPRNPLTLSNLQTQFTEGSVLLDVIDAGAREVLCRGHGRSAVSDEPQEYIKSLRQTVGAILERFPRRSKLFE
ncbi:MAG TPA: DUF4136 domain-containing protein [Gemmatimonadales bacterium]